MSFRWRNTRPQENWQPGQEYWVYLPSTLSDFVPERRTLNPGGQTRAPGEYFEERSIGGPNSGVARFPSAAPPNSSVQLLLMDDYNTYPRARNPSPPTYYEPPYNQTRAEEESRLSQEEQKQALHKLRKQLYSPHMSNIIKRLSTNYADAGSVPQDDDGKRCAICLEDFETKQFVTLTPCNHMFHEECIVPWVKSQGKCPVCRFVIA